MSKSANALWPGTVRLLLIIFTVGLVAPGLLAPGFVYAATDESAADPHFDIYSEDMYPSASKCANCHQQIYDEWSSSSHAYSAISPMFHKFEQKINDLAPTIGGFCVRCHISVGTALGESRETPLWERAQVSREGVTCITCHRVSETYTKGANGERRIIPGDIHAAMFGPFSGEGLEAVVEAKGEYKVATNAGERGANPCLTDIARKCRFSIAFSGTTKTPIQCNQ